MSKPTVLDHLTAPTVTPEVLRIRAIYWRGVAGRNERNGRSAQADRLRANCDAMERQAEEMERGPVVSIVAPARRIKSSAKAKQLGAAEFWSLHAQAVAAIRGRYGDRWKVAAPHGETVLAEVPSRLRSYKGPRGGTIRYGRDHRIPAAPYWPEGKLPEGLTLNVDPPRATTGRPWHSNVGYKEWQAVWAKTNGPRPSRKVAA